MGNPTPSEKPLTRCVGRLLTSAVYNPRNVLVFSAMGDGCELAVQSAAAFAHEGEHLSYWQLQVSNPKT